MCSGDENIGKISLPCEGSLMSGNLERTFFNVIPVHIAVIQPLVHVSSYEMVTKGMQVVLVIRS